jgi:uncharacterized protein
MRSVIWLAFVGFLSCFGAAVAADDAPFDGEVLKKAFELSKTCSKKCANDSVNMVRLPLAQGKVGFLITTNDSEYCGSGGCSSLVVVVSGNKFLTLKEGLGITENQAISVTSGAGDPASLIAGKPSFDCSKASSASARLICGDADLSKADGLLGAKFRAAADTNHAAMKQLIEQQVSWIRARNSRCGVGPDKAKATLEQLLASKPCMLEAINARIAELGEQQSEQSPKIAAGAAVAQRTDDMKVPSEKLYVIANTTPPDAFLSLRTDPSLRIGQRLASMANGTVVKVLQENPDGWWKVRVIATGQEGWALSGQNGKVWITCCMPSDASGATGVVNPSSPPQASQSSPKIIRSVPPGTGCEQDAWFKSNGNLAEFTNTENVVFASFCKLADGVTTRFWCINGKIIDSKLDPPPPPKFISGTCLEGALANARPPQPLKVGGSGATAAASGPAPNTAQARPAPVGTDNRQTFLQTFPEADFSVFGPEGNALRGMFQTLSFRVPSNGMSGRLYCRGKDDRYDLGRATIISISNEERNIPIYLNAVDLNALLYNLKTAAINECDRAVAERKLLDFDAKRPVDSLPATIIVQSAQPCFFAHSEKATDQWKTFQNCVIDQQNKARAEQEERQRIASKIEAERLDRANMAARAVLAARKQYEPALESAEGREFILPILTTFRSRASGIALHRVVCTDSYEYVGGSVLGRSIEGNVGVILVNIVAVNKSDAAIEPGSWFGNQCGNPSRALNPGDILNIEVKGMFRKYDTGWRFERIID